MKIKITLTIAFFFQIILAQKLNIIYPERFLNLEFDCYSKSILEPKDLRLFALFHETLFEKGEQFYYPNFIMSTRNSQGDYKFVFMEKDKTKLPQGIRSQLIIQFPRLGSKYYYFHDSTRVKPNDIVSSIHYAIDSGRIDGNLFKKEYIKYYANENCIKISFEKEYQGSVIFPYLANVFILPDSYKINKTDYAKHPVGSGPFQYDEKTDEDNLYLTFFDKYHTQENFDSIIVKTIPLYTTMKNEFRAGRVNLLPEIPQTLIDLYDLTYIYKIIQRISGTVLWIDHTNPHLRKPRFREALAYSINRRLILSRNLSNNGELLDGPFPRNSNYHVSGMSKVVGYNQQKAKQLLHNLGYEYRKGETELYYNNERVKLVLVSPRDLGTEAIALNSIKRHLENIGIDIQEVPWASSSIDNNLKQSDKWDLYYKNYSITAAEDLYEYYHSTGSQNYQNYYNQDVDNLYSLMNRSIDTAYRQGYGLKINDLLKDHFASIYLWTPYFWYGYNTKVFDRSIDEYIDPDTFFREPHRWKPAKR